MIPKDDNCKGCPNYKDCKTKVNCPYLSNEGYSLNDYKRKYKL